MSENFRMECRKIRKPKIEKLRRARINNSLEMLKQMLLQNTIAIPQGGRPAKLEKADILEMTVRYMQVLHKRLGLANIEQPVQSSLELLENSPQIPLKTIWSNDGIRAQPKFSGSCNTYNKIISKLDQNSFPIYKQEPPVNDRNAENILANRNFQKSTNLNKENENPFESEDEDIQITDDCEKKPFLGQHCWRPW